MPYMNMLVSHHEWKCSHGVKDVITWASLRGYSDCNKIEVHSLQEVSLAIPLFILCNSVLADAGFMKKCSR